MATEDDQTDSDRETFSIHDGERKKFWLTSDDIKILQKYRKEWQDVKGSGRTEVAVKAYEEMLALDNSLRRDSGKAKETRKLKRQVSQFFIQDGWPASKYLKGVQWWLHTYGRKRKSIERFYYVKRWNYRMVLAQRYPAIHQQAVDKLSNQAVKGSQAYLRCYQSALSRVLAKLPGAEIDNAKDTAKKWNSMGPPHEIRAK
jgi:hypothetical protein